MITRPIYPSGTQSGFWKRFGRLYALGMVGVLSFLLVIDTMLESLPAEAAELPRGTLIPLSLVNPAILLAIGVALGLRFAPGLGFRSHILDRMDGATDTGGAFRREIPLAIAGAAITAFLVMGIDAWFQSTFPSQIPAQESAAWWRQLGAGMLYGGVTEELMMRWGLVSLLVWLGMRVTRSPLPPRRSIVWGAIVIVALIFGLGHLPALAMMVPLTTPLIIRTIGLNALAGIVFGWFYWKRSLESAMVAHAATHVFFLLLGSLGGFGA